MVDTLVRAANHLGSLVFNFSGLLICQAPPIERALVACALALGIGAAVLRRLGNADRISAVVGSIGLAALLVWVAWNSMLLFGDARAGHSLVQSFQITRTGRPPVKSAIGAVIFVHAGSPLELEPTMIRALTAECFWTSSDGGAFDDPNSCDVAFDPPVGPPSDVLTLLVRPTCALPEQETRIRLSIAP